MLSVMRQLSLGSKFLLWLFQASDFSFLHFILILEAHFLNSLIFRESPVSDLGSSFPARKQYTNSSHFYLGIRMTEIVFQSVSLIIKATHIIILQQLPLWISNHLKYTKKCKITLERQKPLSMCKFIFMTVSTLSSFLLTMTFSTFTFST